MGEVEAPTAVSYMGCEGVPQRLHVLIHFITRARPRSAQEIPIVWSSGIDVRLRRAH